MSNESVKYFVRFIDICQELNNLSLEQAMRLAAAYVGNNAYAKPFPNENTYLYGPGDGSTMVMIRKDK